MRASCWMLLLSFILPAVTGFCGYPGRPYDSNVLISYDALVQVAHYSCQSFDIDGNTSRRCEQNGKWSGSMPRCGVQVNADQIATTTETGSTCHWLSIGQDINIQFKKSLRLVAVTLETETPYKYYLTSSKWILTANKEQLNPPNIHGATSSDRLFTRWKLNNTTSSLRLILQSENFWLCNVTIHALPDDCGQPEVPVHGHINLTKSEVVYSCDSGFQLVGDATRNCAEGRWSGDEPTCELMTANCIVWEVLFGIVLIYSFLTTCRLLYLLPNMNILDVCHRIVETIRNCLLSCLNRITNSAVPAPTNTISSPDNVLQETAN